LNSIEEGTSTGKNELLDFRYTGFSSFEQFRDHWQSLEPLKVSAIYDVSKKNITFCESFEKK